jgi:choline-glycine betaine transporter
MSTKPWEDGKMDHIFYTLQDFMLYTKGWAYILMGASLVVFVAYWKFLFSRDKD